MLHFPRALFPLPARQLERLTAVPMASGPGIGALTARFLVELAGGIDHYRPAEAARLATVALEVLAARLARELDSDGWVAPEAHRRALLAQIQGFIQRHLGDPGLSPGTVAAANHISVSYLHKLFHDEGLTVAAWIRQRRLEASRRDLTTPRGELAQLLSGCWDAGWHGLLRLSRPARRSLMLGKGMPWTSRPIRWRANWRCRH